MIRVIAENLGLVLATLGILFLGKVALDVVIHLVNKKNADRELTSADNPAFGISFAAYLAAIAIAMLTGISPSGESYLLDLMYMAVYGAFAIAAMLFARLVNDRCVLYKVNNAAAIFNDRNTAVGIVEAGSFIGTALILAGAWTSGGWGAVILWYLVGQALFVGVTFIYQWITPYDIHAEIAKNGNAACGVGLCGFLIGTAWVIHGAVSGPVTNLITDLKDAVIYLVVGVAVLIISRLFTARILLRSAKLNDEITKDKNLNAGLIEAAIYVVAAAAFTVFAQ